MACNCRRYAAGPTRRHIARNVEINSVSASRLGWKRLGRYLLVLSLLNARNRLVPALAKLGSLRTRPRVQQREFQHTVWGEMSHLLGDPSSQ